MKKHGHAITYNPSPTYITWMGMRNRCNNPSDKDYPNYGERGICVDSRWDDFNNFLEDMGERPEGMTLERNDVNGDYCKDNCSWASRETQARNRRNTYLTLEIASSIVLDRMMDASYADIARKYGIERQQVRHICLGNAWWGAMELANQRKDQLYGN